MSIIWTTELDAKIRKLRNDGLSALMIGRKLGMTKGQICGRLWRLDRSWQLPTVGSAVEKIALPSPKPKPLYPPKPLGKPAQLLDLDPDGCKWAISEDVQHRHIFCNAPRLRDRPYCAEHMLKAWGHG